MEKNAKIIPFFYKEWKRAQRSFCSFIKNGKEAKIVLLFYKERKRMQRLFRSFEKNGCPLPNPACATVVDIFRISFKNRLNVSPRTSISSIDEFNNS